MILASSPKDGLVERVDVNGGHQAAEPASASKREKKSVQPEAMEGS